MSCYINAPQYLVFSLSSNEEILNDLFKSLKIPLTVLSKDTSSSKILKRNGGGESNIVSF